MILVFGANGQVARALDKYPETRCFGRDRVDLSVPGQAAQAIHTKAPRAIINAAAYTNVDGAEGAVDQAQRLNAEAVFEMATAAQALDIPLVHISSDYVFDGSGDRPWQVGDSPNPINAYGRSKLAGEQAVRQAGGVHVILRTSWVFAPEGKNFVTTMQRMGRTQTQVQVVSDQVGGPTPAASVAGVCLKIADQLLCDPNLSGTYHFAGTPDVSWADFARVILEGTPCQVIDIASKDYPMAAPRPRNSGLNCQQIRKSFAIAQPKWRDFLTPIPALR